MDIAPPEVLICRVGRALHSLGLCPGNGGNISYRAGDHLLVTPSGFHLGFILPENLIRCDLEGSPMDPEPENPTSELRVHLAAYRSRPEVNAVIHAHPPLLTALTVAGLDLDRPVLPEAIAQLGRVPTADYAAPGTAGVVRAIEPHLQKHNAIVMDRHGCLALGPDLLTALARVEELENLARITLAAEWTGNLKTLSPKQEEELLEIGRTRGLIL